MQSWSSTLHDVWLHGDHCSAPILSVKKQRDDIKRAFKLKKAWYERLLKSEPGVLDYLMTAEDGKAVVPFLRFRLMSAIRTPFGHGRNRGARWFL